MKRMLIIVLVVVLGFVSMMSLAQVSSMPPRQWTTKTFFDPGFGVFRLKLSHNSPEMIRQELLDTNTIHLIAQSSGLSDADLATVQIVPVTDPYTVELYQIGTPQRGFNVLKDRLGSYIQARLDGHTKGFLFDAMTNKVQPRLIADSDLRVLVLNRPFIPPWLVKKADSGTRTNKAGQITQISTTTTIVNGQTKTTSITNMPKSDAVCRWVSYTVTDGEIAWSYMLNFKANGHLDDIHDERCDAKDYDPKFQKMLKDVDEQVSAEMKNNGALGKFGSVQKFWRLKKEKLKANGIDWRSPAELNPNSRYD